MFGVSSMSKIHYQKTLILNVFFEGIYFLGGRVRALTTTLSNVIGVSTLDFGSEKRPQRIQVSKFSQGVHRFHPKNKVYRKCFAPKDDFCW